MKLLPFVMVFLPENHLLREQSKQLFGWQRNLRTRKYTVWNISYLTKIIFKFSLHIFFQRPKQPIHRIIGRLKMHEIQ